MCSKMEEKKQLEKKETKAKPVKKAEGPRVRNKTKQMDTKAKDKVAGRLGVVMIRGTLGLRRELLDTFKMLNIHGKYNLIIVDNNPVNAGMVKKVKDFVTYGEISPEMEKEVEEKRPKGDKKYYRLHPPRGGLERKGSKKTFAQKGALGYRAEKINDLIKRML